VNAVSESVDNPTEGEALIRLLALSEELSRAGHTDVLRTLERYKP
jgi:hypothetical protein